MSKPTAAMLTRFAADFKHFSYFSDVWLFFSKQKYVFSPVMMEKSTNLSPIYTEFLFYSSLFV